MMRKKRINIPQKYIPYLIIILIIVGVISLCVEKCGGDKAIDTAFEKPEGYGVVHFIDAGQGDSILIESDGGKFALIDASTNQNSSDVVTYLENAGVERLEFALFTHPHEDHIGGGDEVLTNFEVGTVYTNGTSNTTSYYKQLVSAVKNENIKLKTPKTGDAITLDGIDFLVLSDGKDYKDDDLNNTSICLRMDYGESSFLFTGDAEAIVERDLLKSGYTLEADVYKAAHHGSTTSNTDSFLDEVNPDICVISCGRNNDYGHPHDEIVSSLNDRNIEILRTDLKGDIAIAFDSKNIIILK